MAQQRFDTFVFDLDGTLLNTLPDLVVLTNGVLTELGYPERTPEEILSFVGNGVKALMVQAVPEGTPAEDVDRALALWKQHYLTYENALTHPYEGIVETLKALHERGCKVGVMSNKFEPGVHQILELCLPGLIEVAHGESPTTPRKPDPTGILQTIRELGSTPENTVYVGDSPGDITAGRAAGAFTVAVGWGYFPKGVLEALQPAPDLVIDRPSDLLSVARKA